MRTYGGIAVIILILMGFPLLAHARQGADEQMTVEQFAIMKSVTFKDIETRQAKLDEVKACINASTQRSEIEKCIPSLNYGVTDPCQKGWTSVRLIQEQIARIASLMNNHPQEMPGI
jgi:hypothetical protein